MRSMQNIPMSHGLQLSLAGSALFVVSLVLLLVIDPVAIVGMVAGALAVFAGLLMTLRTGSDEL